MAVPMWRTKQDGQAECEAVDCSWTTYGANALGNASRHYHATGHVVRVEMTRAWIVGEDHPGENPTGIRAQINRNEKRGSA
jgi:hypothetical protein